jgi:hypothetical protein
MKNSKEPKQYRPLRKDRLAAARVRQKAAVPRAFRHKAGMTVRATAKTAANQTAFCRDGL